MQITEQQGRWSSLHGTFPLEGFLLSWNQCEQHEAPSWGCRAPAASALWAAQVSLRLAQYVLFKLGQITATQLLGSICHVRMASGVKSVLNWKYLNPNWIKKWGKWLYWEPRFFIPGTRVDSTEHGCLSPCLVRVIKNYLLLNVLNNFHHLVLDTVSQYSVTRVHYPANTRCLG